MSADTSDWLIPQWSAPAGVRAICSTRMGGFSTAPYDTLNLGLHVGDVPECVERNRAVLAQKLQARPVFLNQVHGTKVIELDALTEHNQSADGACTAVQGGACTVMVADCLPILLANQQGTAVAALHAGWRGLAGEAGRGIVEAFFARDGVKAEQWVAWLGPCIGPLAFEVGEPVRQAFVDASAQAQACFKPLGQEKWLADLPALARQRLQATGVRYIDGNDGSAPWCTVNNSLRFFSHRRDRVSGRFAASVWLV
jgi:polyphenol oxidase